MLFEALYESARKGELLLVQGGLCRWHLRRDGRLVIREIIATRKGAGRKMLQEVVAGARMFGAWIVVAKCPADLESNRWWAKQGFKIERIEVTPSGRKVNVWSLLLSDSSIAPPAAPASAALPTPVAG